MLFWKHIQRQIGLEGSWLTAQQQWAFFMTSANETHMYTLVYFSWIICVLPTNIHSLISQLLPLQSAFISRDTRRAQFHNWERWERLEILSEDTGATPQHNKTTMKTHKRQSLPRLRGQEKAQEKLLLDRKWSRRHREPETSQLQNSRTHNARDSLTLTEETELLSTWQAVRLSQAFPKVTQPAPRCHVQFQLSTALAPKITGYCFTAVFSRTAVINLQQNFRTPGTCNVLCDL